VDVSLMTEKDPPILPQKKDVMWLANKFIERTPYIFDKSHTYWLWKGNHYEMVDTIEMLSNIYDMTIDTDYISSRFKSAMLVAIQITGRKAEVKEKPKSWVQFDNCIYDMATGTTIEPSPEYLLTTPIPHQFNRNTDTPTFDKLFREWVSEEHVQLLYELCAYTMLDDYPIHRLFLLYGSGRNGKGQFRDILVNIVGRKNIATTSIEGLANSRFESARLFKKKLATAGETNFDEIKNTSMLKMLTGGDPIPGEFKGGSLFDFNNTAKVIINTNSLPPTKDKTDGFYSRWVILNFKNKYPNGKNIIDTIPLEEYDNLVTKCVVILQDLIEKGTFTNEGSIHDKMLKYESLSNPLNEFIADRCELDVNAIVPFWHFEEDFSLYLTERGLRKYNKNDLRKYLKNEGYELVPNHKFHGFVKNGQWTGISGINLKDNIRIENTLDVGDDWEKYSNRSNQDLKNNQLQEDLPLERLEWLDTSHSVLERRKNGVETLQPVQPVQIGIIEEKIIIILDRIKDDFYPESKPDNVEANKEIFVSEIIVRCKRIGNYELSKEQAEQYVTKMFFLWGWSSYQ